METYYQESGRAGRDGLPSECVLFYRPGDVPKQSSMVFYENSGLQNLFDIVRYCQSKKLCRRNAIFRHFGEPLQDCNGMCDNCAFSTEATEVDVSSLARVMVSLLQDTQENGQRLTMLQLVDKVKNKHKESGDEMNRENMEKIVIQLILDRVLKEEFQHTAYSTNAYVTIGPLAKQLLLEKRSVKVEISGKQKNWAAYMKAAKQSKFSGLESKLDELRKELSSSHGGIFPHSVLSSQQICLISVQKPKSVEELETVIGKLKTEKFGSRILEEIRKYISSEQPLNSELSEEKATKNTAGRRLKRKIDHVVIESSDDDS